MRFTRTMIVLFVLMALSTMAVAEVPTTVSYQGRLTTAAGVSVPNGSYSVRFSLWSAATLGTESWNETQTVSVTDGLFSTELGSISGGFFDISVCPPYCDVWLQIEVTIGGLPVTITPRSHLSASPWSLVSRSLYNETSSGAYITKVSSKGGEDGAVTNMEVDNDGDGHADYSLNDSVSITSASRRLGHDSDDDGTPDNTVDMIVTPTTSSVAINTKGTGADKGRTISSTTYPDSAVQVISSDEDGDGNLELEIEQVLKNLGLLAPTALHRMAVDTDDDGTPDNTADMSVTPTTSSVAIKTKGTGADRDRVIIGTTYPDSAVQEISSDHASVKLSSGASILGGALPGGAVISALIDTDDNDIPDNTAEMIVTPTTSSMAIKVKGTGADKDRVVIQSTQIGLNPGTSMVMSRDQDDDGVMDRDVTMVTDSTGARMAIKTKGTGAQRFSAGGDCDDSDASLHADFDADNDGIMENSISLTSDSGGTQCAGTVRLDPTPARISTNMTIERQTKTATFGADCDDDGDGHSELSAAVSSVSQLGGGGGGGGAASSAYTRMSADTDDDGIPDNTAEMSVTPTTSSVAIKVKGTGADKDRVVIQSTQIGLNPGTSMVMSRDQDDDGVMDIDVTTATDAAGARMAIKTKGTGAQRFSAGGDCDDTDASLHADLDVDGDGLADRSAVVLTDIDGAGVTFDYQGIQARVGGRKGWDGTIKGHLRLDNGPDMNVLFESDGDGYVATRFGIGILEPTNPLEHSSGAHLTAGGVWTNASDKKLKENFEQVEGSAILEKIEELPISEWNYKAEGDDVKHIGPTAQDFNKAFDLGGNDKTISTIDPSGVALVAIKELTKQNKELKKKNSELENKLNDLQKQIEKLASSMKK
jgi:Chaperone of endosialidase